MRIHPSKLIIATRQSPLALWQANWVKAQLQIHYPDCSIDLLGLTTTADNIPTNLSKIGGKGLFVKELEEALLQNKADIAVHSMKDVPMELPNSLCLPVICERDDPRDAWISKKYPDRNHLPSNLRVGTSSLRRQSQLIACYPHLQYQPLRGNINTRLEKLSNGEFDAIILAAAGLKRLNLADAISDYLTPEESLPAAGQGALGIECRSNDSLTLERIACLNHMPTYLCVTAERALCRKLGGGCQVPIAAYAVIQDKTIFLRGLVAEPDGKILLRAERSAGFNEAELLGIQVAEDLLQQGAGRILTALGSSHG